MTYDLITIGGGVGGAAIAKAMAEHGARVLVLEAETRFRDRVRGEWLAPWGLVEAKALGLYETLLDAGGHELRYLSMQGGIHTCRDLPATTACGESSLAIYHPAMQEALLAAAQKAGAEVCRGVKARLSRDKGAVTVMAPLDGRERALSARLVVAADGRNSPTRSRAGFAYRRDAHQLLIAGLLFERMPAPEEMVHVWRAAWRDVASGLYVMLFPQRRGRVRAYLAFPTGAAYHLNGNTEVPHFAALAIRAGAPAAYFTRARAIGPLATFCGADVWVDHPYQEGVALIGDAAATTDPTHGQGLSLTLRDVRVLRDQLLRHTDWQAAGHAYAQEHDRYYSVIHSFESWLSELLFTVGPEAEARRDHALPLWRANPTHRLDILFSGPDQPFDETARRRFFGEE